MSEKVTPGRLVPKDFTIQIEEPLKKSVDIAYPGYPTPSERLKMTSEQIRQWEYDGLPHAATRKNPTLGNPFGENFVMDHPNYRFGLERGKARPDDGEQDMYNEEFRDSLVKGGYARDSRGIPVHPYYRNVLENGALGGFGFYWDYGPNQSADAVTFGTNKNQLHFVAIEKPEASVYLVPGGMIEKGENPQKASLRELAEETGLDVDSAHTEVIYQGILAGTPRQTLHAWEESASTLIVPKDLDIRKKKLKGNDDAAHALWLPVTEDTLEQVFVSHRNYIKKAVLLFEEKQGVTITPDGTIKNA